MTVLTKKEGHLVSSRADEKSRDSSNVHVMPAERGVFDGSHAPAWEPSRTIRRFPSRANIIAGMARLLPTSTAAAVRAGPARELVSLLSHAPAREGSLGRSSQGSCLFYPSISSMGKICLTWRTVRIAMLLFSIR